jgi:hypothetical protein
MTLSSKFGKMKAKWVQKIKKDIPFYVSLYILRKVPIIVYQMGRVGSASVANSLRMQDYDFVFHVHRMNPQNIKKVREEYISHNVPPPKEEMGRKLYRHVALTGRPAEFISLVRDPISRNVSAFFRNFRRFTGKRYEDSRVPMEELAEIFIKNYNHDVPLNWFDDEPKQALGIDVYEYPFEKKKGYAVIEKGNFRLLILKLELEDRQKEKALEKFLGSEHIHWMTSNQGEKSSYGSAYKNFLRTVRLSPAYLETMCNSRYMRHFYSDNEIQKVRDRWLSDKAS